MKKVSLILTAILAMMLVAALCAMPMAAADNVIFLAGEGAGTGDGSSAENALIPTKGNFDASAKSPELFKDTAMYQAWMKLMEAGGGTIVVCGPVVFDNTTGKGTPGTTMDVYVPDLASYKPDVTITYTSVYNGVDYRETADAKILLDKTAHLILPCSAVFENINIQSGDANRSLCAGGNSMTFSQGTKFLPVEGADADTPANYPVIVGGQRWMKMTGSPVITIDVGNENPVGHIFGGQNGAGEPYPLTGDVTINLKSGRFIGDVNGTSKHAKTTVVGNVTINIEGGIYEGTINGVSGGGFKNEDSTLTVKVTGGDFANSLGLFDSGVGVAFNLAKYALLDLSGADNATATSANGVAGGFHETILPAGFAAVTTAVPETTAAPSTTHPDQREDLESTEAVPGSTTEAPAADAETTAPAADAETTAAPETTAPAADAEGGSNIGLIIGIVAAVIVIAVVVAVVLKKKKA